MDRTISRKKIGSNIKALAKWYGFKIGEIEKDAGVSQGYLSRLANDPKGESSPIFDLLLTASDRFKVSIDSLVAMDFNKIADSNKMRLHGFFETLLFLTNRGRLNWKRHSIEIGIEDVDTLAAFSTQYNDDISFYIAKTDLDDYYEVPGYSFYIQNKKQWSTVIKINLPGPTLYESLDQLFESAAASMELTEIDDNADRAIRFFMSENSLAVDNREERQKYYPLYNYLSQQTDDVVRMTFDQIEEILDFNLPVSSQRYPSFWANNENGQHHHCKAWLDAGYRTVNVPKNIIDKVVFFEKIKTNQ